jgi:hypothetical protein
MPLDSTDFRTEEYKSLRAEVLWLLKDYRELERNIALACGALLAWLFARPRTVCWTPTDLAWFIPFLLTVIGGIRATGIFRAFDVYHGYLIQIESSIYGDHELGGWEHYLEKPKPKESEMYKKDRLRTIGSSRFAYTFWIVLILSMLAVGVLFGLHLV